MGFLLLLPLLVSFAGAYMLVRLRFFFFRHPIKTVKKFLRGVRGEGSFSSLALALAGTLGVGNIFGVSVALISGGAGALFWIFVSSLFSSVIKYSEVIIATDTSDREYGMISVINKAFGKHGGIFGALYASLALMLSFVMGGMLQARSVGAAMCECLGTDGWIVAAMLLLCVIAAVQGGASKIKKTISKILPLTTIIYIFMTLSVIFTHFSALGGAVSNIIIGAFSPRSFGSGIGAYIALRALREGFACGMLSNEAGAGTSAFAHGTERKATPVEGGLLGAFEAFFDTGIVCMLTGLAILVAVPNFSEYSSAMLLVCDALFSTFGYSAAPILSASVFMFAVATVVCWFYYGNVCRRYLFGKKFSGVFAALFFSSVILGIFSFDSVSVRLADTILLFMSFPTLFAIIKSSDRIAELSEKENMFSKKKIKANGCERKAVRRLPRASRKTRSRS